MNKDWWFTMGEDWVVIHDSSFPEGFSLNLSSLKSAINHIKGDRATYATEEAWMRNLTKYREALAFLEANLTNE